MRLRRRPLVAIGLISAVFAPLALAGAPAAGDAGTKAVPRPTPESALAAEEELARAIRDNDADGIARMLSDDWAVIAGTGGVGEGKSIFPDGIRSGHLTRKTFELSEPRVRVYGDFAVITAKVKTSGMFNGKPFDVIERETDVMLWKQGGWKVVLTHETLIQHV